MSRLTSLSLSLFFLAWAATPGFTTMLLGEFDIPPAALKRARAFHLTLEDVGNAKMLRLTSTKDEGFKVFVTQESFYDLHRTLTYSATTLRVCRESYVQASKSINFGRHQLVSRNFDEPFVFKTALFSFSETLFYPQGQPISFEPYEKNNGPLKCIQLKQINPELPILLKAHMTLDPVWGSLPKIDFFVWNASITLNPENQK